MKIVNVTPGLIPIPPNGWGAIEKIIWEIHNNLLTEGHDSHILYLDDVPNDADVVHIHVANLANMAHDKGIPYYFTLHDHHAYLYGKDSDIYKENLLAMKNAIRAFVPAKYLVDYFEGIPEYFSHGVNDLYFTPSEDRKMHKLLCVANNGYAYDQTIDRKGFGIAIEAAKEMGLPITIAGPSNNKNYFEKYPPNYDKLTILYDLDEKQLLDIYRSHTIFLHPSELEAGHPNLTLVEALSCGLPIVGTLEPNNRLDGMVVVNRNTEEIVKGIHTVIESYGNISSIARQQGTKLSWNNRTKELVSIYNSNMKGIDMKRKLINHYSNTKIIKKQVKPRLNFNNIDGMFAEILGGPNTQYSVSFINDDTDEVVYSTTLNKNNWARVSKKYFINWRVEIVNLKTSEKFIHKLDLKDKRVYIALDSKSLGDTLAWFPYVDEFRKKHKCTVITSTFWNDKLKNEYPHLEFVLPGQTVNGLAAMYTLGLFYTKDNTVNYDYHAGNTFQMPLQQIASDILGLEYTEIRPKVTSNSNNEKINQVCIAVHSTSQAKYWNNPFGWQSVVNWLNERGYTVRLLSNEGDNYMGNRVPTGVIQHPQGPIEDVIDEIKKSKAFIGLGSGLSWLSWSLEIPTVLISGFSYKWAEMTDCIRVGAPKGKCEGCFNRYRLDAGDWNWCPDHKGTPRQFECSREITPEMVIQELEKIL